MALRAQEREEERALRSITHELAAQRPRINVNTATRDELMQLKGIGEKRADAIISARPFKTPADVFRVPGLPRRVAHDLLSQVEL